MYYLVMLGLFLLLLLLFLREEVVEKRCCVFSDQTEDITHDRSEGQIFFLSSQRQAYLGEKYGYDHPWQSR